MADEEIFSEKSNNYRGVAKIELRHFDFERTLPGVRTIRQRHIDSLVDTFESEGCLRHNPDNFVKVLIDDHVLQQCLQHQNLHSDHLLSAEEPIFLNLPEDVKLSVIHGKHRLLAAERFLLDKWWIAQLYSDELDTWAVQIIEEEHPNAQAYCHGDIYRNIRHHQVNGNVDGELKWRGRLNTGIRRSLARMEKDFKRLTWAFDQLLPFVGLWESIKLSYLNRWLSVQSPEELIRYLTRIHRQWNYIMEDCSPDLLDPHTVVYLETLMPDCSLHDRACIQDMIEKRSIFPAIEGHNNRQGVLNRVLSTKGRILSLYTFSRDFVYFEACSTSLRKLLPPKFKSSLSREFMHSYRGTNQFPGSCHIQTRENAFSKHYGSPSINPSLGYRQLFLAVMRDFPVLSNLAPYRDLRRLRPDCPGVESESLFKLACLSFKLGFETRQVEELLDWAGENSDQAVTREFLRQVRPPVWFIVNTANAEDIASYVGRNLPGMATLPTSRDQPKFTTNLEMQPKKFRCSRPSFKHYEDDRMFLFIDVMYNYRPVPRAHATSLAIQRDIFVCYFGESDLPPLFDESPASGSPASTVIESIHTQEPRYEGTEPDIRYQMSDEERMRPIDDLGIRVEPRSPSFQTTSISTATSAQEMGSEVFNLDLLSEDIESPEDTITNSFRHIDSPRPSLVVKRMLADEGIIVLYAWETRQYAKFSINSQQRLIFENVACDLADNGQHFLVRTDRRVYAPPLSAVWDAACNYRLVLAGPKPRRSDPGESMRFLVDRDPFTFIDHIASQQTT